jgi:hypothetical protein
MKIGASDIIKNMQLFGDLDILSLVRISRLNWTGNVNRMDIKRKVIQVFNNNPHGSRLRGRPNNKCWNCVHRYQKIQNYNFEREIRKQS